MDDQRMPKKILRGEIYKSRKRRRPRIRWLDCMMEDLRRMDVCGHAEMAVDMRLWKQLLLEARSDVEEEKEL